MGDEMSGDGDEPAPAAVWARARERYEQGVEALAEIAAEAGITRQALTVGAGGYIGGRSLEKVAGTAKARKPAGFPFIRGSDRKG